MARHLSPALLALFIILAHAIFFTPSAASQLNIYNGRFCGGSTTYCRDRACCNAPENSISYRFYYNPSWKAYLYDSFNCSGPIKGVIDTSIDCFIGLNFKSASLTDGSTINMVADD